MPTFLLSALFLLLSSIAPAQAIVIKPLRVVTSFSILADMAKNVGGDLITVIPLVGPEQDIHTYQPTPNDLKTLAAADIIFLNGLGLEGWIERLIPASGTRARVVVLTTGMQSRIMYSVKGIPDPHAWQNLSNGRIYIHNIADALEKAMPDQTRTIYAHAVSYDTRLTQLDQFVKSQLAPIPTNQKVIVSNHDAFTYFSAAYGIRFLSPIGTNTEAEPSASNVALIISQIRNLGIRKIFMEGTTSSKLIEQIAEESGAKIGGKLYADTLSGPNGPAATYIGMFQNNVSLMKSAMMQY